MTEQTGRIPVCDGGERARACRATGVDVGHAMVHGGPFPSTSDFGVTSVGAAIDGLLRPVAHQDVPALLPGAPADDNPDGSWRRMDGALGEH
ncbi:hypothetical protein [Saccharopolyspora elongata]|uniref:hypothetical protein n=1 Tax=Saccharopolyspora elongata TaxID=2530387 RepID=UPI001A9F89F9|nr:hypothetical protein [Saccharopolyspora elongata]